MSTNPYKAPHSKRYRRVRFVCISDTHNQTLKLPKGDVLVHAGDLTNQGSFSEVRTTILLFSARQYADFWLTGLTAFEDRTMAGKG